jgi:hypothetical protein
MKDSSLSTKEIEFIKKRHKSKQLFFALLFKFYKNTYSFRQDFTGCSQSVIDEISQILGLPAEINAVSSRTYDDFCSLIRKYFKTSFPRKENYRQLVDWIKTELLPNEHLSENELKEKAFCYLREQKIEPFKNKKMKRIIKDAINGYEKNLFSSLRKNLSNEAEARLNGLLLPFKDGLSCLGWINKEFNDPSLASMISLIEQLSILNSLNFEDSYVRVLPKKRISHYANTFTRFNPSHLKGMQDNDRCSYLLFYCYIRRYQIVDKIIDMFNRITGNIIHKFRKKSGEETYK